MYFGKVEICGINTAKLKHLTDEEQRALLEKNHAGDKTARQALIDGNLRLVLSIVQRFAGRKENTDDLFQVGCIGLIKSIDNFNPELEVKFSTYAVPMIIGEIRRYLRDNNAIRVSRSVRDLAYRALSAREELSKTQSREPTAADIAKALGEEEGAVSAAMRAIVDPVSIYDAAFSDGEDSVFVIDQISDHTADDERWLEDIALRQAMRRLGKREKSIIRKRYYFGKTQMEIAEEIGISQAQVSRLEKSALSEIRKSME